MPCEVWGLSEELEGVILLAARLSLRHTKVRQPLLAQIKKCTLQQLVPYPYMF